MRLFLPYVLYTVWCLSKSYAHNNNCKNNLIKKKKEKEKIKKEKETKEKHSSTDRD
jgi:cell division protein FtsB